MTTTTALKFLALVLTGLALVPAGAHLFEMPHKIAMPQADYFTVQAIYRGWALFGIAIAVAVVANFLLALRLHRDGGAARLAGAAFLLMTATLVVFFVWAWPANEATAGWTVPTADWRDLRMQWEAAHSANALLTFIAFCCTALAASLPGER